MSDRFRPIDRETPFLFPPSVQKWLPENHLARFVVEVVRELDLRALEDAYSRRGSPAYPPAMLLALLFYGYATGVYSSRKLEEATYDSVAFRYIAANTHPDHDTIAHFRKRFLEQLKPLFVEILLLAHQMGFLKLGTVSLDGTKVKANASKHRALSWAHVLQLEEQLRAEVEELLRRAEAADGAEKTALDIPAELARREERLQALKQAKAKLVERAAERYAAEQAEYEAKLAKREATQQATGKKPRGRKPKPPEAGPRAKDQINLTDEESRIMPVGGGGFEQAYNAQAVVETDSLLVVEARVTQEVNDQGQMEPAPEGLGGVATGPGSAPGHAGRQRLLQWGQCRALRGRGDHPVYCGGSGETSRDDSGAGRRARAPERARRCGGTDEAPAEDHPGARPVRTAPKPRWNPCSASSNR